MSQIASRLEHTFSKLRVEGRSALVSYVMAGDPSIETSRDLLEALSASGADVIELGMPFTDPMADGPIIQAANIRALTNGMSLQKTLTLVQNFRQTNTDTPIVLMGYYNPIYVYGAERFATAAKEAGVDGVLIVDLPPEEDGELRPYLAKVGIDLIRLITPTSSGERLKTLVKEASGFLYYVSIAGVTGTAAIDVAAVTEKLKEIRAVSSLPIAVGFGIRTPSDAKAVAAVADGVVIGSAFVKTIENTVPNQVVNDISRLVQGYRDALT